MTFLPEQSGRPVHCRPLSQIQMVSLSSPAVLSYRCCSCRQLPVWTSLSYLPSVKIGKTRSRAVAAVFGGKRLRVGPDGEPQRNIRFSICASVVSMSGIVIYFLMERRDRWEDGYRFTSGISCKWASVISLPDRQLQNFKEQTWWTDKQKKDSVECWD